MESTGQLVGLGLPRTMLGVGSAPAAVSGAFMSHQEPGQPVALAEMLSVPLAPLCPLCCTPGLGVSRVSRAFTSTAGDRDFYICRGEQGTGREAFLPPPWCPAPVTSHLGWGSCSTPGPAHSRRSLPGQPRGGPRAAPDPCCPSSASHHTVGAPAASPGDGMDASLCPPC